MLHKHDSNQTINGVNYISSSFTTYEQGGFLGLLRLNDDFNWWGINISDIRCCGVYLLKCEVMFGDSPCETVELIKMKPYVLYFKGGDNTSYFLRFDTGKSAYDFYQKLDSLCESKELMYYNS